MSKPLWFKKEIVIKYSNNARQFKVIAKKSNLLFFVIAFVVFAVMISLWDSQTISYAHAAGELAKKNVAVPQLLNSDSKLFAGSVLKQPVLKEVAVKLERPAQETVAISSAKNESLHDSAIIRNNKSTSFLQQQIACAAGKEDQVGLLGLNVGNQDEELRFFTEKLYAIVGDAPIREMVPFISQRNEKVAAFLVGIAKKESSFGLASPSKDGKTCYNYWGYKGTGGRGTGMGYACFASAQEAIQVVGDRIEVLVDKERNTPARMVDTWKCGKSCAGDPGASSWVATVTLYFDKIVG
ncbi:MAG: hypothetical protein HGA36_04945 [Candidatus Moranbacteria bacterium]|nr:hypothetical protein [Candidatus Moranbacteria bacterium]